MLDLSITSGYGSASLLEQLYADADGEPMAGVLIYTATSDNEGTLAGLEREGLSKRSAGTVQRALRRSYAGKWVTGFDKAAYRGGC